MTRPDQARHLAPPSRSSARRVGRLLWHPAVAYGVALLAVTSEVLLRRAEVVSPPSGIHEAAEDSRAAGAPPAAETPVPPRPLPSRGATLDLRSQSIAIPLQDPIPAAGLEVRIRDETGTREVVQRFDTPTREGVVVAQLPAGWLALGGRWDVEVHPSGAAPAPPARRFTVEVPRRIRD